MEQAIAEGKDPAHYIKAEAYTEHNHYKTVKRNRKMVREYDYTSRTYKDEKLWEAYTRVKEGMESGKSAEFFDIIDGAEHPDALFPDGLLGHLMGTTHAADYMREHPAPGFKFSLWEDFKSPLELGSSLYRMSTVIVERLSQIEVDERPIRIIWAACRSEQLHPSFDDMTFQDWVQKAAAARRSMRINRYRQRAGASVKM